MDEVTEVSTGKVIALLQCVLLELQGLNVSLALMNEQTAAIHKAVAPEYDIYFSPRLNLTTEQKRAMALAAMKAMQGAGTQEEGRNA